MHSKCHDADLDVVAVVGGSWLVHEIDNLQRIGRKPCLFEKLASGSVLEFLEKLNVTARKSSFSCAGPALPFAEQQPAVANDENIGPNLKAAEHMVK